MRTPRIHYENCWFGQGTRTQATPLRSARDETPHNIRRKAVFVHHFGAYCVVGLISTTTTTSHSKSTHLLTRYLPIYICFLYIFYISYFIASRSNRTRDPKSNHKRGGSVAQGDVLYEAMDSVWYDCCWTSTSFKARLTLYTLLSHSMYKAYVVASYTICAFMYI